MLRVRMSVDERKMLAALAERAARSESDTVRQLVRLAFAGRIVMKESIADSKAKRCAALERRCDDEGTAEETQNRKHERPRLQLGAVARRRGSDKNSKRRDR